MSFDRKTLLRDYYPINEAASLVDLKLDDFLYLAATAKIVLYVLADAWCPSRIYQFKRPLLKTVSTDEKLKKRSLSDHTYSIEEDSRNWWIGLSKQCKGLPAKGFSHVEKEGPFGHLYSMRLSGPKPIARHSFVMYRATPSSAILEIDLNLTLALNDEPAEMYFTPEPSVLVADAIRESKVVVMSQDIEALAPEIEVQDTRVPVTASGATNGRNVTGTPKIKDDTQAKYDLWQAEAEKLKAEHPVWNKSYIATKLAGSSSPIPIHLRKSPGTIRKHIKI